MGAYERMLRIVDLIESALSGVERSANNMKINHSMMDNIESFIQKFTNTDIFQILISLFTYMIGRLCRKQDQTSSPLLRPCNQGYFHVHDHLGSLSQQTALMAKQKALIAQQKIIKDCNHDNESYDSTYSSSSYSDYTMQKLSPETKSSFNHRFASQPFYGSFLNKVHEVFSYENIQAYGLPLALKAFEIYQRQRNVSSPDTFNTHVNEVPNICKPVSRLTQEELEKHIGRLADQAELNEIIDCSNLSPRPQTVTSTYAPVLNALCDTKSNDNDIALSLEQQIKESVSRAISNNIVDYQSQTEDEDEDAQSKFQVHLNCVVTEFADALNRSIDTDPQTDSPFPENLLPHDQD